MEVSAPKVESKSDALKASQKKYNSQGLLNQIKQLGDAVFSGLIDSLKTDTPAKSQAKVSDDSEQRADTSEKKDDVSTDTAAPADTTVNVAAEQQIVIANNAVSAHPTKAPAKKDAASDKNDSKPVDAAAAAPATTGPQTAPTQTDTKAAVVTDAKVTAEVAATEKPTVVATTADTSAATAIKVDAKDKEVEEPAVPVETAPVAVETTSAPVPKEIQAMLDAKAAAQAAAKDPAPAVTTAQAVTNTVAQSKADTLSASVKDASVAVDTTAATPAAPVDAKTVDLQAKTPDMSGLAALVQSGATDVSKTVVAQTLPLLQSAAEYFSMLKASIDLQTGATASAAASHSTDAVSSAALSSISSTSAVSAASSPQTAIGFNLSSNTKASVAPQEVKTFIQSRLAANMEKVEDVLKTAAKSKDGTTLSFRLDPPSLGSIKVDVTVKDNTLVARVSADHPEVQLLLKERLGELQQSLAKAGMDIERMKVVIREPSTFEQTSGGFFQGEGQKGAGSGKPQQSLGADFADQEIVYGEPVQGSTDDHWVA